jgi:dipeptidase
MIDLGYSDQYSAGLGFERPVSLWRTAYSSITQSRRDLPDTIGAVAWIAQYAPHFSTFVPVYASAPSTPSSLRVGTQCKFTNRLAALQ